jgi:Fic/DOC family protein
MAKITKAELERGLEQVLSMLKGFPRGASLETIRTHLNQPLSERTLSRYLAVLQQRGKVRASGATRSRLYHWISDAATPIIAEPVKTHTIIPLSLESQVIRQHLTLSAANRKPVGYNLNFLASYRPNVDFYLNHQQRSHLFTLGQTSQRAEAAGTYARQILQRLLIDLSWNSSRLEGNTYSLLDTQRLLAQGKAAPDKSAIDAQMILNHKEAIEFLVESAGEIGFNRYTITNLHGLLSYDLLPDPGASGRLRTHAVGINQSVYTPLAIPQQIEENFELLLTKAEAINDPFEQAFFAMVHLPYLQPFDDVNKRVSRLAANIPLNKTNLAPLAFVDVPQDLYIQGLLGVYELLDVALLRDVFLWAYERSCLQYAAIRQTLGEPDPFRLQYREDIRPLVAKVVTEGMAQEDARRLIEAHAMQLPTADRAKFLEVVETELLKLHAGNIARYRIRPSEFEVWQEKWVRGD